MWNFIIIKRTCLGISHWQHGIRHNNLRHLIRHEGFHYTLNRRTADGQTYWRCHNRACPGRVVTDINDQLVSCNDKHTHQPNTTERAIVSERECEEKTTPISRIYHDALQEVAQQEDREDVAFLMPHIYFNAI